MVESVMLSGLGRSLTFALSLGVLTLGVPFVAAQDATECAEGTQAFEHALGTACVAVPAERVVTLEWSYTEDLLALGMQPVGAADITGYELWVKIPVALDETVVDVGTRQEPNLEAIAALNPDLIIAPASRVSENFDELSAIAPTLAFDAYPTDGTTHYAEMVNTFNTIAQAVGREAEAEAMLADVDAYFAAATTALEDAGRGGEPFVLSQGFMSSEVPTFRLFTDNAMAVEILSNLGLENAWGDAPQLYGFTTVDMEGIAGITGDTNFIYVAQDDYETAMQESALWNAVPFVVNGRSYWLGGDVWLFGGPLSAKVLVDTVLTGLGVELLEVNPAVELTPEATAEA
jgi:iron complex transport system substrate-binding protein